MRDGTEYKTWRFVANFGASAAAITGPTLWLFSRLTPYHFLFSAPVPLGWLATVMNVCAFTGYLVLAGLIPTFLVVGLAVHKEGSGLMDSVVSLAFVLMAGAFFFRGLFGPQFNPAGLPDPLDKAIALFLLLPVIFRWTPLLQRSVRAWPTTFLVATYSAAIAMVIWVVLEYTHPSYFASYSRNLPPGVHINPIKSDVGPFYESKSVSSFGLGDWLATVLGAAVYFSALAIWKRLIKEPPTPESNAPAKSENAHPQH